MILLLVIYTLLLSPEADSHHLWPWVPFGSAHPNLCEVHRQRRVVRWGDDTAGSADAQSWAALDSLCLWCVSSTGEGCIALRAAQFCYTEFHITLTHHGEKTGTLTGGIQLRTSEGKTTEKLYGKTGNQLRIYLQTTYFRCWPINFVTFRFHQNWKRWPPLKMQRWRLQ